MNIDVNFKGLTLCGGNAFLLMIPQRAVSNFLIGKLDAPLTPSGTGFLADQKDFVFIF